MSDAELHRLVQAHKAMAHPARLRILAMLRGGELCACQITAVLQLAPSTISAHLADLRRAGLIEERKDGRWVYSVLATSEWARRLLMPLWEQLPHDPRILDDARILERLRRVSLEKLCRADLDLGAVGIELPVAGVNFEHD
jgi:ArsR family transcriptional regulator